jgi:uracil-DNA glycosylase
MMELEKEIFECSQPEYKGNICPVAKKFKENNKGERPIPEAYLGNPESKFMIIGVNPGQSTNYLCADFGVYQTQIRGFLKDPTKWSRARGGWVYDDVIEIFGYPSREEGGVIITNLVHCPTPSWAKNVKGKWKLSEEEKQESIKLCGPFCLDLIKKINPELVLLHGPDAIRFFSDRYGWNIKDPNSIDMMKDVKKANGRNFVLSPHLVRLVFCSKDPQKPSHRAWQALKETAKELEKRKDLWKA